MRRVQRAAEELFNKSADYYRNTRYSEAERNRLLAERWEQEELEKIKGPRKQIWQTKEQPHTESCYMIAKQHCSSCNVCHAEGKVCTPHDPAI